MKKAKQQSSIHQNYLSAQCGFLQNIVSELLLKSHEQISLLEPGIGTKNMSSLTFLLELMHIHFRNEYNLQHRGKIFFDYNT